jgi:predicted enzyme related to lactoylglutathione lyase
MTPDPKAAIAFYTDVVGWKTQAWEGSDYTMWIASDGPLGGVSGMPERASKAGIPPHWTSNVLVADVDATVAKARKMDAKVLVEPSDIPKVGRFAVIADPQGASISVFAWTTPMPSHDGSKAGNFCWNELATTNHESAFQFYSALFGWQKSREFDMGPHGKYLIYGAGGVDLGGMFTKGKDTPKPPSWLYYVEVMGLDAAVGRAKAKGAKILNGPMEVPGGARIAQLADPQGVPFALHEAKK